MAALMPAAGCDASCQAEATQERRQRLFTPSRYRGATYQPSKPRRTSKKWGQPRRCHHSGGSAGNTARPAPPPPVVANAKPNDIARYGLCRPDVADGDSPNRRRYSAAKRPRCVNPQVRAISVTLPSRPSCSKAARTRAKRASRT